MVQPPPSSAASKGAVDGPAKQNSGGRGKKAVESARGGNNNGADRKERSKVERKKRGKDKLAPSTATMAAAATATAAAKAAAAAAAAATAAAAAAAAATASQVDESDDGASDLQVCASEFAEVEGGGAFASNLSPSRVGNQQSPDSQLKLNSDLANVRHLWGQGGDESAGGQGGFKQPHWGGADGVVDAPSSSAAADSNGPLTGDGGAESTVAGGGTAGGIVAGEVEGQAGGGPASVMTPEQLQQFGMLSSTGMTMDQLVGAGGVVMPRSQMMAQQQQHSYLVPSNVQQQQQQQQYGGTMVMGLGGYGQPPAAAYHHHHQGFAQLMYGGGLNQPRAGTGSESGGGGRPVMITGTHARIAQQQQRQQLLLMQQAQLAAGGAAKLQQQGGVAGASGNGTQLSADTPVFNMSAETPAFSPGHFGAEGPSMVASDGMHAMQAPAGAGAGSGHFMLASPASTARFVGPGGGIGVPQNQPGESTLQPGSSDPYHYGGGGVGPQHPSSYAPARGSAFRQFSQPQQQQHHHYPATSAAAGGGGGHVAPRMPIGQPGSPSLQRANDFARKPVFDERVGAGPNGRGGSASHMQHQPCLLWLWLIIQASH
jgi:hypothetical protein